MSGRSIVVVVVVVVALAGCGLVAGIKDLSVDAVDGPDATVDADGPNDAASTAVVPDPPLEAGCVSTGPHVPGEVTVTAGGNDWSDPQAVKNQDDLPTIAQGCCNDNDTRLLGVTAFGFAVPAAARIQGIKVLLRARATFTAGTFQDKIVRLARAADGGVFGDNLFSPSGYGMAWETRQYGSATTLWSAPLTPDIVNSPDFGLTYQSTKGYGLAYNLSHQVDAISMTVYYCR